VLRVACVAVAALRTTVAQTRIRKARVQMTVASTLGWGGGVTRKCARDPTLGFGRASGIGAVWWWGGACAILKGV
jgi:hypothetical protein